MKDVKIYDQPLLDDKKNVKGKLTILVGGLDSDNPKAFMDNVVSNYVGRTGHNQFVEIHLDNPWTRVIVRGINDLSFRNMTSEDSIDK